MNITQNPQCPACGAPVDDDGAYVAPAQPDDDGDDVGSPDNPDDEAPARWVTPPQLDLDPADATDDGAGCEYGRPCPFQHDKYSPDEHARAHDLLDAQPDQGPNYARTKLGRQIETRARATADAVRNGTAPSARMREKAERLDRTTRRIMSETGLDYPDAARRALSELPQLARAYEARRR